jgi:hypothetical protein
MAITIDPRPTVFGDRFVVTGTYAATDTSIELAGHLTSIDMAVVTPTGALAPQNLETAGAADASDGAPFTFGEFATVDGTTITVNTPGAAQATIGGTFMAIGRRA